MAKVFLSAGHGGSDPGAVAYGLKEKEINLQTLLACKAELERHGVTVVCSRTRDENDPVTEEVREANASNADVAVSFHANAGGGDGFEAYYWENDRNGKRLSLLGEKYVRELGQNAHGTPAKSGNHLCFVRDTKMTAVLFESFFVDSADRFIGDTVEEQKKIGVAYAKAILEYLGLSYIGNTGNNMASQPSGTGFLVKVLCDLNIRTGPGIGYAKAGCITDNGTYTIVETKDVDGVPWGRLKSGAGWISIHDKYVKGV